MRFSSLTALIFGAMFLFTFSGCAGGDDDDSVHPWEDDDDTGVGDDDDTSALIINPFEFSVEPDTFLGYDEDGVTSRGYETVEDFTILIDGEEVDGHTVLVKDTDSHEMEIVADDYVHAPISMNLGMNQTTGEWVLGVAMQHQRVLYEETFPNLASSIDDEGMERWTFNRDEVFRPPMNYDATGSWWCVFGQDGTMDSVSEDYGEMFTSWFGGVNMFANGRYLRYEEENGYLGGTISEDGNVLEGTAQDSWGSTWNLRCDRQ